MAVSLPPEDPFVPEGGYSAPAGVIKRAAEMDAMLAPVDNGAMAVRVTTVRTDGELPMKVVGRRRWAQGLAASAPLLRLVLDLRGDKPFLPRGVHRFRSFEESEAWTLRMLARLPKPGPRS